MSAIAYTVLSGQVSVSATSITGTILVVDARGYNWLCTISSSSGRLKHSGAEPV